MLALESTGVDPGTAVRRLEETLDRHDASAGRPYKLALSVGVAQQEPGSTESLAELLRRADAEMYRVKQRRQASSLPGSARAA